MPFLPICRQDLEQRNIQQLDFVYISGDAYVDHPSFGCAIITRVLEAKGFTVGVLAQPDWKHPQCFLELGVPKYAFLVSAGNLDSMVAHYTVAKQRRSKDAYSPGEKIGLRPDRAVTVYTQTLRSLCPNTPILIGGLEASLRRFAHYDYWSDSVRPSVLEESGAEFDVRYGGAGNHPDCPGFSGRKNFRGDAGYPRHLLSGFPGRDPFRLRGVSKLGANCGGQSRLCQSHPDRNGQSGRNHRPGT